MSCPNTIEAPSQACTRARWVDALCWFFTHARRVPPHQGRRGVSLEHAGGVSASFAGGTHVVPGVSATREVAESASNSASFAGGWCGLANWEISEGSSTGASFAGGEYVSEVVAAAATSDGVSFAATFAGGKVEEPAANPQSAIESGSCDASFAGGKCYPLTGLEVQLVPVVTDAGLGVPTVPTVVGVGGGYFRVFAAHVTGGSGNYRIEFGGVRVGWGGNPACIVCYPPTDGPGGDLGNNDGGTIVTLFDGEYFNNGASRYAGIQYSVLPSVASYQPYGWNWSVWVDVYDLETGDHGYASSGNGSYTILFVL